MPDGSEAEDVVVGPNIVGAWLNLMLYTLVLDQTSHYFTDYPFDLLIYKITVLVVIICDTLTTIGGCANAYGYSVWHQALSIQSWSLPLFTISSGLSAAIIQAFMLSRYYILTKRKIVVYPIALIILTSFASAICFAISFSNDVLNTANRAYILSIWTITTVMADMSIAIALIIHYLRADVELTSSKRLIHRLCVLALKTGSFTAITAIVILIFFIRHTRDSWVYIVFGYCIGRIYSLTLLYNLNIRKRLLGRGSTGFHTGDIDISTEEITTLSMSNIGGYDERSSRNSRVSGPNVSLVTRGNGSSGVNPRALATI